MARRHIAVTVALAVIVAGCGGADDAAPATTAPTPTSAATPTPDEASGTQRHPDVVDATLERSGDRWRVAATLSSPYDSPDRYADAFRVLGPDGTVLGVRELLHDHANEQPFTRSLDDVQIPDDVDRVTVEGRDLANGWGGDTVTVTVPP